MLPLQPPRSLARVHDAAGSSAATTPAGSIGRVRRTPANANRVRQQQQQQQQRQQQQQQQHSDTTNSRQIETSSSLSTQQQPQQRVRRRASSSSSSSSTGIDARKNPELYSLTAEQQQQQQQQQQEASSSLKDHASSPRPMLSSVQGSIGSTGAYSSAPEPHAQQQQHAGSSSSSSSSSRNTATLQLRQKPEVLAPAGGWPQLRAAVENGADAVYFGVTGFNARARAANFSVQELPEVMSYLRARGVKGYVALNVLVFDEELHQLERVIRHLATAGVDALIVQDIGAVALAQRVAPHLPIHGSTQMSITSAEGAQFAAGLGVTRVVVGRELSVREIAKVAASTDTEVEAFCHGALCVSYSGQCFSSEAWGGRSANRGQCAQACRMPYGLIVDGVLKDLQDVSYLLSPQDLMALEQLPAMVAAGVGCFKIEGRLKGPEYVAATTAAYRAGVDAAWQQVLQQQQQQLKQQKGEEGEEGLVPSGAGSPGRSGAAQGSKAQAAAGAAGSSGAPPSAVAPPKKVLTALAQVFSRAQDEGFGGLTPGFLEGSRHQRLVRGRAPRHRGLCLGRIAGFTSKGGVLVRGLLHPVKRGDGVVFDQGRPEKEEQGGSVWELMRAPDSSSSISSGSSSSSSRGSRGRSGRNSSSSCGGSGGGSRFGKYVPSSGVQRRDGKARAGDSVELRFAPDQLDVSGLSVGDLVWKNRDPALEAQLRATYEGKAAAEMRKTPVQVSVSGALGAPLQLQLTDGEGRTAVADTGDVLLSAAVNRALGEADVVAAIGQLGDNTLTPSAVDVSGLDLSKGLFLPASAFKAVRRAAADQLLALQQQHTYADGLAQTSVLPELLSAAAAAAAAGAGAAAAPQAARAGAAAAPQAAAADDPAPQTPSVTSSSSADSSIASSRSEPQRVGAAPEIRVLCRTPEQVSAALAVPWLREVVLDFLEVHGLKEAVAAVRGAGKQVVVALPRILKPDESRLLLFYLKLGVDALLLRGAGPLQQLIELGGPGALVHSLDGGNGSNGSSGAAAGVRVPRLEGDFSLNAANVLSADLLLRSGLSRLCPTYDLNAAQLVSLAEGLCPFPSSSSSSNRQLEAVVHQHLPIFHTEHCVFCRFLSEGNDYRDCGHPCERHSVQLRDSSGADHLVLADMGCRNTVFNVSAQSGLYYLPALAAAGYGTLRVELVNEPAELVAPLLETYRRVLQGRLKPREAWRWLQDSCAGGVAAGSLEVKGERAVSSLRPSARRS